MKTNDRITLLLEKLQMLEFQQIGISATLEGEKPDFYTMDHERRLQTQLGKTLDDILGLNKKIRRLTSDPAIIRNLELQEKLVMKKLAAIIRILKEEPKPDSVH